MTTPSSLILPTRAIWAGYAACLWACLFAATSFYWAAGGTLGADTLGDTITQVAFAHDPWFIALLWATGALKAVAGLIALALIQPWGRYIPRWLLLTAAWLAGIFMTLYGGANLLVRALMTLGIISTPASMYSAAANWHLLLWDPWWLLGGLLFIAAAWWNRPLPSLPLSQEI